METGFDLTNLESGRLPKSHNDISYDTHKNELVDFIASRETSCADMDKLTKENIEEEFEILQDLVDFEPEHERNLYRNDGGHDRYSDILPYKDNFITTSEENYVNGSYISLPKEKSFIATQGPKSSTVEDFWQMMFDNNSYLIIMLCNLTEKQISKCHKYWADYKSKKIEISLVQEKTIFENLISRTIRVNYLKHNETREINQLHFTGWPDHGVPELNTVFEAFNAMFKQTENVVLSDKPYPIVVHCSAGVGRTGTFIAIFNNYFLFNRLFEKKSTNIKLNIWNTVRKLKEQRRLLIENKNQYYFVFSFISKYVKKFLK